jgi:1,4-dihydroxy-2-naphthoyl-CoA hydrolase
MYKDCKMDSKIRDVEWFNNASQGRLPGHLGIVVTKVEPQVLHARLEVMPHLLAPNGYLHAGTVVTLADTAAGFGCMANLPEGATSFTTIELKSNHLGTCREGVVLCVAKALHAGRTTQVWDAIVTEERTGKTIALFRCTQMILYSQTK